MALAPRYHPALSKQPPNILADVPSESLVNCTRTSVAKIWSRGLKLRGCLFIFFAYISSPRFLSFYRRDGFANMWRDPYFLVSFIYWICYLFFLVYLMFKGRRTPQIWQDKIRQVLAGWDKGGTVLVLGSPYNMGPITFAEELPFDTNSMDVVLSCDILRTGPRKNKEFFEECLAESLRVIKPGGRAIVMTVDSTFRRRSKKIKAYLEQAEIEFTVERHDGSVWYDITKPVSEKYIV
ncbi:hypothetical protein FRC19_010775 [Serendipita sp. 401]|nr:hypothetical protein FRC19_010775 [Serendipita sp. 401]